MAAKMMPGGPVADAVFEDLVPRSEKLVENGHTPGLGTILVGDDGASARYVGMKMEKARQLGWSAPHQHLPESASQADVLAAIRTFNDDPLVDGFLIQHPTPPQIDFDAALLAMDPAQDVDGMHLVNMGGLPLMSPGPRPPSPSSCPPPSRRRRPASRRSSRSTRSPSPGTRSASSGAAPHWADRSPCCCRRSGRRRTPRTLCSTPGLCTGASR